MTATEPTIADPVAYFRRLVSSGRFHRDSGFGRIYHPGSVSLRENAPADSLHIVVNGDHISAHVDKVSPLGEKPGYSFQRTALHNVVGAAQDLVRLLRGRKGDHRSHLDCAWVWEGHQATPDTARRMGLFVVSRLAERHDITAHLARNPGGGMTASVLLPPSVLPDVSQSGAPAAPAATPAPISHRTL